MNFWACNFLRENHNDFWGPPKKAGRRQSSVVTVLFTRVPKPQTPDQTKEPKNRSTIEPKTPKNWKRNTVQPEPQRQHVAHALAKSNLHTNVANALQKLRNHRGFFSGKRGNTYGPSVSHPGWDISRQSSEDQNQDQDQDEHQDEDQEQDEYERTTQTTMTSTMRMEHWSSGSCPAQVHLGMAD
ncbi:uncharacterized protein Dyak_GE21739 [Drosophila yakuba]|uniref:Uncharacterized protein n=1 Tax=Drosophila yakuba TaxID=7245 RepID=A0A0R1E1W3_DROYA|nr:uncharacterized protein Dyak_GE21739 [Drosophila yakuba]